MSYSFNDNLILSLTKSLVGNEVKTENIIKALELICKNTFYDCGLIYEVNFNENFSVIEQYNPNSNFFPLNFEIKDLSIHDIDIQKNLPILFIEKNSINTAFEKYMLNLFNTNSLIFAPIYDENNIIYGFVVLLNCSFETADSKSYHNTLTVAISILIRYIDVRMYQKKLSQAQITMESILDNTGIDIYVNDFYSHDILYVNKSMAEPYGGQDQFMGHKCWQVLFPGQNGPCEFCPQKNIIDENGMPTQVYTWDYQRAFDGSWFRVFSAAFKWINGRLAHVVSSADITDNKRNEALVENMANYDELTGLPNRRMLLKECDKRIDNAEVSEKGYVLFFDIDGFKSINDNFGHDAGDEFLIQLGSFFSEIPLLKNAIFRNGGDEFVAIVGGNSISKSHIKSLTKFIHDRFKKPWKLKKGEVFCNTSIGIACYPEDGKTTEILLQKADMAMYKVKKNGGGNLLFVSE